MYENGGMARQMTTQPVMLRKAVMLTVVPAQTMFRAWLQEGLPMDKP